MSQTHATWMFVTDLDDTFVLPSSVHQPGLAELSELLASREGNFVFAVATGRSLAAVRELFDEYRLPHPDFVLASVGTRIHGGLGAEFDATWDAHLDFQWLPEAMRSLSEIVPGMRLQEPEKQDRFKVSFYLDAAFELASLSGALSRLGLNANVIISQGKLLDLLPLRASKGRAVYYLANKLEIPLVRVLAAGDSGNDRDMLETAGHAVVVANHATELADLRRYPTVLFSAARGAEGILDGIRYHRFPMTEDL